MAVAPHSIHVPGDEVPAPAPAAAVSEAESAERKTEIAARAGGARSLRRTLQALLLLAILACAYVARTLLFPIILAVVLALLLRPAVIGLAKLHIKEGIGAALVLIALVGSVGALATYLYEPATRWASMGPSDFRRLEGKLRELTRPVKAVQGASERVAELAKAAGPEAPKREVVVANDDEASLLTIAQGAVATVLVTIVLLYFLLASGDMFLRKLIRVIPGLRDRILAVEITRSVQSEISRYFAAITCINIGLGTLTGLAMYALGMPSPALIGTIAGVLNFLPYVGSAVTLLGVTIVSAVTFDTPWQIALPPLIYFCLTTLEGQFVQPLILGRHLALNPVMLFVWVLIWGWLWGAFGLLVAVPMIVALRICAEKIPGMGGVAELLRQD